MLHLRMFSLNWVRTMLKALLKKQLLEFFSSFFLKGDSKKQNGKGSKTLMIVLFAFVGISFFFMFFSTAFMMSPVIEEGSAEIYFGILGTLASLFGIFGSVFLTYNTVYEAKDNDLLLSMPIPPKMILFSRMAGLYVTAFIFEALVMIPAITVYFIVSPFNLLTLVLSFFSLFILPLLALSISCFLGWVIAFFSSKLRNKSIITVVFSLAFFLIYYFFTMRLSTFINLIIENAAAVGDGIKKYLYPLYKMGQACAGDILSFFVFLIITGAVFSLVYFVLSLSFLKLATSKKGMKKAVYKEKRVEKSSVRAAFLKKELLFFKSTPAYMLNSGLGAVMLIIVAVLFFVRSEYILQLLLVSMPFPEEAFPVLMGFALCFVASTNNLTSSSISLEAKNLWFVQSVPVNINDVFFGKLMLHILVTGIPLLIADIIVLSVLDCGILMSVLVIIFTEVFMLLCAVTGLIANLLFPKTDWVNEAVPIKQSASALIGMMSGLVYTVFILLLWYFVGTLISSAVFLIIAIFMFLAFSAVGFYWLAKKGTKRFMNIH